MKRYLIPIMAILVLASVMFGGCGNGQPQISPTAPFDSASVRNYFDKALPIVEAHTEAMGATVERHRKYLELFNERMRLINLSTATKEEIAKWLAQRSAPDSAIFTIEAYLHQLDSDIVNFKTIKPPPLAEVYQNLIIDSFLKDQVALKDWLYYWQLYKKSGSRTMNVLERADRNYQDAEELRVQAQHEANSLLQKAGH